MFRSSGGKYNSSSSDLGKARVLTGDKPLVGDFENKSFHTNQDFVKHSIVIIYYNLSNQTQAECNNS
jgi:hypothetical protein